MLAIFTALGLFQSTLPVWGATADAGVLTAVDY